MLRYLDHFVYLYVDADRATSETSFPSRLLHEVYHESGTGRNIASMNLFETLVLGNGRRSRL